MFLSAVAFGVTLVSAPCSSGPRHRDRPYRFSEPSYCIPESGTHEIDTNPGGDKSSNYCLWNSLYGLALCYVLSSLVLFLLLYNRRRNYASSG